MWLRNFSEVIPTDFGLVWDGYYFSPFCPSFSILVRSELWRLSRDVREGGRLDPK